MKTGNVVAGLMVVLALASAAQFNSAGRDSADDGAASLGAPTTSQFDSTVAVDSGQQATESEAVAPPQPACTLAATDRYVKSTNLFNLVEQLRTDADAGDADAMRVISRVYDECFPYAANQRILHPQSMSRFRKEPDLSIALAQRATQLQRCAGFIATGVIKADVLRDVEAKAAALDDSIAKVRNLAEALSAGRRDGSGPHEMSENEIDLASTVALSKDVEAIAELSHVEMGTYPAHGFAWQLVACDLGRDCGANGYLMRHHCLYMGQCVAGNYREVIRRKFLPPDQFDVAQAREQEILQAIKRGDVSHLFR